MWHSKLGAVLDAAGPQSVNLRLGRETWLNSRVYAVVDEPADSKHQAVGQTLPDHTATHLEDMDQYKPSQKTLVRNRPSPNTETPALNLKPESLEPRQLFAMTPISPKHPP